VSIIGDRLHLYDQADAIIDSFMAHELTYDSAHAKLATLLHDDIGLYFFELELSSASYFRDLATN
jgi:hypothetical protein